MNMKSVLIFCCSALVSTSLSVNADLLGADKLIEELASSEKTEVYYDRVKAADGSPLDETSVVDSEKYQKLIVTTKNETDEQILYEDCERKVEYIVSSEDRSTCYVHNMTEDEVVRLCFRREETYKKGSKNPKQTVIDGYTIGGESQSKPKLLPEMCANKKVFTLIPKLDKKFGKPEKSDSEVVDARFLGFTVAATVTKLSNTAADTVLNLAGGDVGPDTAVVDGAREHTPFVGVDSAVPVSNRTKTFKQCYFR